MLRAPVLFTPINDPFMALSKLSFEPLNTNQQYTKSVGANNTGAPAYTCVSSW